MNFKNNKGAVAVEFVLIAPVLILIMAGLFEFCRYMWIQHEMYNMIRSGMQYLFNNGTDFSTISSVMENAVNMQNDSNLTIAPIQCGCANLATDSISWTSCPTLDCSDYNMEYVNLQASYNYSPIFGSVKQIVSSIPTTIYAGNIFRIQ